MGLFETDGKMKYLYLDASFEGARKLAECLIGSKVYNLYNEKEKNFLRGHRRDSVFISDQSGNHRDVFLIIDKLKLCPFMSAKNKISVLSYIDGLGIIGGLIAKIEYTCFDDDMICEIFDNGELIGCDFDEISLDFDKLPDGCEIIEATEKQ